MKSTINFLCIIMTIFLISCASTSQRSKTGDSRVQDEPMPVIDPQGHSADVNGIVFTRDGKQLVSASSDKTIRVWDIQTEKTVRIIRGEIDDNKEGKINAMALSPDERYIAVGGWMGPSSNYDSKDVGRIRLYNFQTGKIISLLRSHSNSVISLAFSADSKWLVSGDSDGRIKIWDVQNGSLVRTLDHGNYIWDVAFSPDGVRIVSASDDNTLRLWKTKNGKLIRKMKMHTDDVHAVAYSPDGKFIASGGYDNRLIIWDGRDGTYLKSILVFAKPASISFSPDSKHILVGAGSGGALVYKTSTWEFVKMFIMPDDGVTETAFAPDGKTVATAGINMGIYIYSWEWQYGVKMPSKLSGEGASVEAVGFNKKDGSIGFTNKFADILGLSTLTRAFNFDYFGYEKGVNHDEYTHPILEQNNWSLALTEDGRFIHGETVLRIRHYGKIKKEIKRDNTDGSQHNAFTFTPDGSFVISGGSHGVLTAYNLKGKKVADFIGHIGRVGAVAVSPDGSRLVSGSADQTVKIWSLKDLKKGKSKTIRPLVTLYAISNDEWVLWTPEGYFAASANGAKYIGYHINQGPEKEAAYVSVDKLYDQFYRPDLVEAKLRGQDISQYAKAVNIEGILRGGLAPKIEFITKSGKSDTKDIILKANISDAGGGIGDVTLYLNGIAISLESGDRGMKRKSSSKRTASATIEFEKLISLLNGTNRISLMAYNRDNTIESNRPGIELIYKSAVVQKPNLHILTIAVDKYRDGDLRLNYSVDDATGIINTLKQSAKPLFDNIFVYNIYDDEVRKDKIKSKFEEIGRNTTREDVFLMFVAGHGITNKSDGSYYFLPVDFRYTSEEAVVEQGISMNDFKLYLSNVKALKSLLLIDTCNSGSFAEAISSRGMIEKTAINKLVRATGRATIVASSRDQVALEGYEGHGVFTYILLEALNGDADSNRDGRITISELATWVEERLPEVTYKKWGYEQIPQKSLLGMDFPIVIK